MQRKIISGQKDSKGNDVDENKKQYRYWKNRTSSQRLGVVSEKPNIYILIPQSGNITQGVEIAGEMKLDSMGLRGTWWNKNHDWTVGTERYAIYKNTIYTFSWC